MSTHTPSEYGKLLHKNAALRAQSERDGERLQLLEAVAEAARLDSHWHHGVEDGSYIATSPDCELCIALLALSAPPSESPR